MTSAIKLDTPNTPTAGHQQQRRQQVLKRKQDRFLPNSSKHVVYRLRCRGGGLHCSTPSMQMGSVLRSSVSCICPPKVKPFLFNQSASPDSIGRGTCGTQPKRLLCCGSFRTFLASRKSCGQIFFSGSYRPFFKRRISGGTGRLEQFRCVSDHILERRPGSSSHRL